MSTVRIFSDIARRRNDGVAAGQPVTRLHVNRELRLRMDGRETIPESAFFSCWRQEDADGTRGTKRKCSIRYCGLRRTYTLYLQAAVRIKSSPPKVPVIYVSFPFVNHWSLSVRSKRRTHGPYEMCVCVSACASVSSQWPI